MKVKCLSPTHVFQHMVTIDHGAFVDHGALSGRANQEERSHWGASLEVCNPILICVCCLPPGPYRREQAASWYSLKLLFPLLSLPPHLLKWGTKIKPLSLKLLLVNYFSSAMRKVKTIGAEFSSDPSLLFDITSEIRIR